MQDNQTELETTAAANDTSCSCPSARELAVTRFQQARAFAAAKVNQIRKAATEQASTICDYARKGRSHPVTRPRSSTKQAKNT